MKIGVFDSGLGGLSILREVISLLPHYDYTYLGDNARVPYGNRSPELIYQFTQQAVAFLFSQNCHLVIVACNSATASALRRIQQEFLPEHFPDKKVLGVVRPAVEYVTASQKRRVGVIGTRATINSKCFEHEIQKLNQDIEVYQQACPLLVPLIEEGETTSPLMTLTLHKYLDNLIEKGIQSLILGCTHYSLIKDQIRQLTGSRIEVVCEGPVVAQSLRDYLNRHAEIECQLSQSSGRDYFVTDLTEDYNRIVNIFLGAELAQTANLQKAQLY